MHITYTGNIIPLNQAFSTGWRKLRPQKLRIAAELKRLIAEELKVQPVTFDRFQVGVTYNSRHDCDNCITLAKSFVDCLVGMGVVKGDSKQFYRSVEIKGDEQLPKNCWKLKVEEVVV